MKKREKDVLSYAGIFKGIDLSDIEKIRKNWCRAHRYKKQKRL